MKSLSLSRPLVLIMIGVPGSGKSFFARQFAETFSAPLVSYDQIRWMLFDPPQYTNDQETIVSKLAAAQLSELLKTQKTMLVDGGHDARVNRMALVRQAREAGYDTLTVWVQTDEATSKQRATRRTSRRQGDTYNVSLTEQQFATFARQVTAPSTQEPYIVISGKHTYASQAKVVLKKLVQPRQLSAQKPAAYSAQNYNQPQPPTSPPRRRHVIVD